MTFVDAVEDASKLLLLLTIIASGPFLLYLTASIGNSRDVSIESVLSFIGSILEPSIGAVLAVAVILYVLSNWSGF